MIFRLSLAVIRRRILLLHLRYYCCKILVKTLYLDFLISSSTFTVVVNSLLRRAEEVFIRNAGSTDQIFLKNIDFGWGTHNLLTYFHTHITHTISYRSANLYCGLITVLIDGGNRVTFSSTTSALYKGNDCASYFESNMDICPHSKLG